MIPESDSPPEVPPELIAAINRGNCVAFVGAGFSGAAGLPSWKELLNHIAQGDGVSVELRALRVRTVGGPGGGHSGIGVLDLHVD